MGFEHILYEVGESVCLVTLNRPDKLNALSDTMLAELLQALEGLRVLDQTQVMAGPFSTMAGPVKALGNPVKLSASPATMRKAAPVLGEDTEALPAGLGYGTVDVARLREKGVLGP